MIPHKTARETIIQFIPQNENIGLGVVKKITNKQIISTGIN